MIRPRFNAPVIAEPYQLSPHAEAGSSDAAAGRTALCNAPRHAYR
jgi:hypothetical protein